ncbi:MAG: AMP-binding protein [Parasporobacterium sp.]|nr:AMP-binding protein [Parasporobacterium sp.]
MAEWMGENGPEKMTFEEGKALVETAAARLKRQLGFTGRYVALDMENSWEWIICFWAILKTGNHPYLVNRRHPAGLKGGLIKTLDIMYAVASEPTDYPCIFIDSKNLTDKTQEAEAFEGDVFGNEFAISTSATTLNEVICVYTGTQVAAQILNCKEILNGNELISSFYKGALKQLAFLPFYHIFGLFAVYFWFAFFHRPMVFMRDYSAESILGTVRDFNVTHIFAVPMLWHTIENQVLKAVKEKGPVAEKRFNKGMKTGLSLQKTFPKLGRKISLYLFREVTSELFGKSPQFLISGGGYIKDSTLKMMNAMGYALHNGYGMSETGITSVELGGNITDRLKNSIGKPFSSVEYVIEEGELIVKGASLCAKLIRNGEEQPVGESYHTGDVVKADEKGGYYIIGRKGDRIIGENGENIDPDIIEKELKLTDAAEYAVLGLKDDEVSLVIQLERSAGAEAVDAFEAEVRELNDKLPSTYFIKKIFYTFDPIRSEQAVKVSRPYLKRGLENGSIRLFEGAALQDGEVSGKEAVKEDDETALRIRKVFAEFVEREEGAITMDDHFIFDLGGTSLDYFSLVMQINEEFGVNMIFDKENACYTIRSFKEKLEKTLE